jgi:hypothetical protein
MLTRLAAALVASALIGQAQADPTYPADDASRNVASALLAQANCQGVKLDGRKIAQMIVASHLDVHQVFDRTTDFEAALIEDIDNRGGRTALCDDARSPLVPFHFLPEIEN